MSNVLYSWLPTKKLGQQTNYKWRPSDKVEGNKEYWDCTSSVSRAYCKAVKLSPLLDNEVGFCLGLHCIKVASEKGA